MSIQELREKQAAMSDQELAEKCENLIHELSESGGKRWRICVPAQVNDSDMLLCEIVRRFRDLTKQGQTSGCRHDKEPILDEGGFYVCPDCGTYGEDC